MVATVVTANVSNRSAAMPAQSPTLSPTLSAMVAGLRGTSSGNPASTFPTRAPPTSAPLGEMAPPHPGEKEVVEGDAQQREAGDQHPGHRARLEGHVEAAAERGRGGLGGAHVGPHRDVHADEAGRARQHGAD